MKTAIKTLRKRSDEHSFGNLTFWLRDVKGNVRGVWVSGSVFRSGKAILGIRMVPDELYPIREVEDISDSGDARATYSTEFGPIKARIYKRRLFVTFPNEVVTNDEFPAQRTLEAVG